MECRDCGYDGGFEQTRVSTRNREESVTYCPECGEVQFTDPV